MRPRRPVRLELSVFQGLAQNRVMPVPAKRTESSVEDSTAVLSATDGGDVVAAVPWGRVGRTVMGGIALTLVVLGCALAVVTRHVPEFYRQRMVFAEEPLQELSARRLLSDLSALQAAFTRDGDWEAAIDEDDINAWLAIDLPRNHQRLLPGLASAPRVRLSPKRIEAGLRLGVGPLSAVAWMTAEIRLREPNQLAIVLDEVRLGGLPLPRGPVLAEIATRCRRLGVVTALRPLDGRNVLVIYIPSTYVEGGTSHWLESLAIGDGTIAGSGRTFRGRERPPER